MVLEEVKSLFSMMALNEEIILSYHSKHTEVNIVTTK
jgi:hypothetical protein